MMVAGKDTADQDKKDRELFLSMLAIMLHYPDDPLSFQVQVLLRYFAPKYSPKLVPVINAFIARTGSLPQPPPPSPSLSVAGSQSPFVGSPSFADSASLFSSPSSVSFFPLSPRSGGRLNGNGSASDRAPDQAQSPSPPPPYSAP